VGPPRLLEAVASLALLHLLLEAVVYLVVRQRHQQRRLQEAACSVEHRLQGHRLLRDSLARLPRRQQVCLRPGVDRTRGALIRWARDAATTAHGTEEKQRARP